jgi:hypothetical protein
VTRAFPSAYLATTRAWVLRRYLAGDAIRRITRRCRVSRAYVVKAVKLAGIGRGIPASRAEERARRDAEIVARRAADEPCAQIAVAFGLCVERGLPDRSARAARRATQQEGGGMHRRGRRNVTNKRGDIDSAPGGNTEHNDFDAGSAPRGDGTVLFWVLIAAIVAVGIVMACGGVR